MDIGIFSAVGGNTDLELEIKDFFNKPFSNYLNLCSPYVYIDNQKWTISISFLKDYVEFTFSGEFGQNGKISFTFGVLSSDGARSSQFYTIKYKPGQYEKKVIYKNLDPSGAWRVGTSCTFNIKGSLKLFFHFNHEVKIMLQTPDMGKLLQDSSSQTLSTECAETLLKDFKELLTSGRHSDVKIKVGEKEFQAHKLVLAARSRVLDSMFSQDMIENISGVVNISDCDADTFEAFLTFLYSGQLDQIPSSNIVALYDMADKYDLPELTKVCVKRLILTLSVDTVCDALRLAVLHEEKELMEKARNFFIENAEEALESSNWESFLNDHLKIGTELFKLHVKKSKGK